MKAMKNCPSPQTFSPPIKADFHLHSTASDGALSPSEILQKAAEEGMSHVAITDHDTFAGVDAVTGEVHPLSLLPGIELSITQMRGLHLLGYGFTPAVTLRQRLVAVCQGRVDRARKILQKLEAIGLPLDMLVDDDTVIGRWTIAKKMLEKGYATSVQEAFDRYLAEGQPAFVEKEPFRMVEAITLLRENGFVPVMAHPALIHQEDEALFALWRTWQEAGLLGIEVYHPSTPKDCYGTWEKTARDMGFLVTSGSDDHGDGGRTHAPMGGMVKTWPTMAQDVHALFEQCRACADE